MNQFFQKNEIIISRVAIVVIFLALIRTIGECFRLSAVSESAPTFEQLKPFLAGALTAAVSCLIMVLLLFFLKHKLIIAICVLTIISLLIIKSIYL